MSIRSARLSSNKGFTLVELLIVVAIIGVLASQGVPAYKRMIQKSRKGEAQVMLGNIATAESAFFSEYGMYGTNLARMGAAMDGNNFIYAAGLVDSVCAKITASTTAIMPKSADAPSVPASYYTDLDNNNKIGRSTQAVCKAATMPADTTAPKYNAYTATATGFVRGGDAATLNGCSGAIANCDQWSINSNRVMTNDVDGVL